MLLGHVAERVTPASWSPSQLPALPRWAIWNPPSLELGGSLGLGVPEPGFLLAGASGESPHQEKRGLVLWLSTVEGGYFRDL
jgi:hypothetical protein